MFVTAFFNSPTHPQVETRKSQPRIEPGTPGCCAIIGIVHCDQTPLIQLDAIPRSHPLRFDAARSLS